MIKLLFLTMTLSKTELPWFYLWPGFELPKGVVIMWFLHSSWGIQGSDKSLGMDLGINDYKHTQVSCQSSCNYFVPRQNIKKKKSHLTYPKSGPSTSPYLEGSLFSPIKVIYTQSKQTNKQKPQIYTIHGIQSEKSHTILSPRAKHVSIFVLI